MLGIERPFRAVLRDGVPEVQSESLRSCSKSKQLIQESTHGEHKEIEQGRTQKSKTHIAQESEDRKTAEAAGICSWLEEAQSEEDGSRRGEAVKPALSIWHLARNVRGQMLIAKCQELPSGDYALWLKYRRPTRPERAVLEPRTTSFSVASRSTS
jgi:hypothetical protein